MSIFKSLAKTLRPDAIIASNTSSISITKLASAVLQEGQSAASEEGKASVGRVVGMSSIPSHLVNRTEPATCRHPFLQSCTRDGILAHNKP
jgi:hypothetical protein